MRSYFPKEILKQIWLAGDVLHGSYDLGPYTERDEVS